MDSLEEYIKEEKIYEERKPSEDQSKFEESISESTLLAVLSPLESNKTLLHEEGLFFLGGDICCATTIQSDSTIYLHSCYPYPAVTDPGIEEALQETESPTTHSDNSQELYLRLCDEMNICPVRKFHKNLLSSEIDLSYYGVDPRGIRPMAMALQYNNFVTRFDLTDNFLNDDSCYHLGLMLKSNDTLKELILTGCRIGASGLRRLWNNLHFNCSLVSLKLDRNNIGDSGGAIFANLISSAYVKEVNLSKNGMGEETATAFVEGLDWRNPLTHLNLSWNDFSHMPSSAKMLKQLANSELLQELNLTFTSLEGEHVASALGNILNMPELRVLDLSHNLFQGEAINLIVVSLIQAKKLNTLNMSYNPMSPHDAYIILQKMLSPQVKLQNLLMDNVCVNKTFMVLLNKVSTMKFRDNFVVTHGEVLKNWTVKGPDPRILLLKRAYFLSKHHNRRRIDIALYFLKLSKEYEKPVPTKEFLDRLQHDKVTLSESFINELTLAFEGPPARRSRTVDLQLINECIRRLWPDKQLPPTPPPEPEHKRVSSCPPPSKPNPKKKRRKRKI